MPTTNKLPENENEARPIKICAIANHLCIVVRRLPFLRQGQPIDSRQAKVVEA